MNLIDTPGHVDFSYEVSRSLAACEGALLVVDAAQGIEAQTLANLYLALENDLQIIPVLNKIDLPGAQPERYAEELAGLIGGEPEDCLQVSGKTGVGVPELLEQMEAIQQRISESDRQLTSTRASIDAATAAPHAARRHCLSIRYYRHPQQQLQLAHAARQWERPLHYRRVRRAARRPTPTLHRHSFRQCLL